MSTQYYTATSIDGYIADADNSRSWLFQFDEPGGLSWRVGSSTPGCWTS